MRSADVHFEMDGNVSFKTFFDTSQYVTTLWVLLQAAVVNACLFLAILLVVAVLASAFYVEWK